jgi:putative heme-binding domain-containing protein
VDALAPGAEQRERLLQAGTEALRTAVLEKHPHLAAAFAVAAVADLATERARWARIDLSKGDAARGKIVFEQRQCARCHAGNARLGPDLKGVAQRWSAEDLFLQIADPNRTISPTWKGERFVLKDGREFTGSIVYDSPAGMLVQITPDETIRVTGAELRSRAPSDVSLMPPGLLQGLSDSDLADLHAWLAALK